MLVAPLIHMLIATKFHITYHAGWVLFLDSPHKYTWFPCLHVLEQRSIILVITWLGGSLYFSSSKSEVKFELECNLTATCMHTVIQKTCAESNLHCKPQDTGYQTTADKTAEMRIGCWLENSLLDPLHHVFCQMCYTSLKGF